MVIEKTLLPKSPTPKLSRRRAAQRFDGRLERLVGRELTTPLNLSYFRDRNRTNPICDTA